MKYWINLDLDEHWLNRDFLHVGETAQDVRNHVEGSDGLTGPFDSLEEAISAWQLLGRTILVKTCEKCWNLIGKEEIVAKTR